MVKALTGIKSIKDFSLKEKRVFLRLDLNVPMRDGKITDDTRIQAALPTIKYALEQGAHLVIASHLGRPKGPEDRETMSLEPVAQALNQQLGLEVILVDDPRSDAPKALLGGLKDKQVIMLENLRFDSDETKNGEGLAHEISKYVDIYINDAFGASHRAHSSVVKLPSLVEQRGVGFLMEKELSVLGQLLEPPAKPFVTILGGAKVSDKIGVIENLIDRVDLFIIGGAMAYTFLAAKNIPVGSSLVERVRIRFAAQLMDRLEARKKSVLLPVDHIVVSGLTQIESLQTTKSEAIPEGFMGVDIGPKTVEEYRKVIGSAKTIFWNGPMGVFETPEYSSGTFAIAKAVAESSAFTVVGGGDSAAAAQAAGYADKMTHISTGGGASLEFLQGDHLPGIEVLRPNRKTSEKEKGNPYL
ncbi:MAG: phosphoglycerate kinase [Pseudobdellovibrionaceae bacterium]|nr:MAG: phosphoglycerate kinase [Pseudobdellovibrionaceae bacterium]